MLTDKQKLKLLNDIQADSCQKMVGKRKVSRIAYDEYAERRVREEYDVPVYVNWTAGIDLALRESVEERRFGFQDWQADDIQRVGEELKTVEKKVKVCNLSVDDCVYNLKGAYSRVIEVAPISQWRTGSRQEKDLIIQHYQARLSSRDLTPSQLIDLHLETMRLPSLNKHRHWSVFQRTRYTRSRITVIEMFQEKAINMLGTSESPHELVSLFLESGSDLFSDKHCASGVTLRYLERLQYFKKILGEEYPLAQAVPVHNGTGRLLQHSQARLVPSKKGHQVPSAPPLKMLCVAYAHS